MKTILMVNGEYGPLDAYKDVISRSDFIIAVDGGANKAYQLDVKPDLLIGDMDSIDETVYRQFKRRGCRVLAFSAEKDFTDTRLALQEAEKIGSKEIIMLGSLGKRDDHALANIYNSIVPVRRGIKVLHWHPEYVLYIVTDELFFTGTIGDTVSILTLTPVAEQVSLTGFYYPLEKAQISAENPIGLSNVLMTGKAHITLAEGILAVFHYRTKFIREKG